MKNLYHFRDNSVQEGFINFRVSISVAIFPKFRMVGNILFSSLFFMQSRCLLLAGEVALLDRTDKKVLLTARRFSFLSRLVE